MKLLNILQLLVLGSVPVATSAEEITAAVASNFMAPMRDLVTLFEKESGHKIQLTFGASGKFYAQIKNGARFQVFLSADEEKPLALERDGLAVPGTRFTYAIGRLALWSGKSEFVDLEAKALKQGNFNKLAIANPLHAPYGEAALQVLQHLSLAENLQPKLVLGENIAQTYQFVETGNAELGFVSLSQIMVEEKIKTGSAWIVPPGLHAPIRQDAVLLKRGEYSAAARELLRFIHGERAQSIFHSYGYQTEAE